MIESIQNIPLNRLLLSETGAQSERRKRFDKAALGELTESLKEFGLLQPIVVRPRPENGIGGPTNFDIVAGERRFLAAQAAGLTEISASVRELTDEQVLEIQLIENLQREGLHELVEAEGYETLMRSHGYTVDDLVAKVGKSKGYVYGRLKLLALSKPSRKAFFDGELSASIALLVARIPNDQLQAEALEIILGGQGEHPMSYRAAAEFVHDNFMLKLGGAPFPIADATLLPAAGPCGTCPKRTGNAPDLFGDVKGADVCTDPVCFKAKKLAHFERRVAKARADGQNIIEGKAAQAVARYGTHNLEGGYVALTEKCYDDAKQRTYRQILGSTAKPELLLFKGKKWQDGDEVDTVELIEVVKRSALDGLISKRRETAGGSSNNYRSQQRAQEKKARREMALRTELVRRIRAKRGSKELSLAELKQVALAFWHRLDHDAKTHLFKLWGREPTVKKSGYFTSRNFSIDTEVAKASAGELAALLIDVTLGPDIRASTYSLDKPARIYEACKRYGIKPEKVRAELLAAEKAKAKKPAKKK